jgi:hypothetical protein
MVLIQSLNLDSSEMDIMTVKKVSSLKNEVLTVEKIFTVKKQHLDVSRNMDLNLDLDWYR